MHQFHKSLKKANSFTSDVFLQWYPAAQLTDGKLYDFELNGERCELKVNFYPSGNLFIETHSNYPHKPGGPWQSKANDCDIKWFVYADAVTNTVYWFLLDSLLSFCNTNQHEVRNVFVKNPSYVGRGLLFPKSLLAPIASKIDNFGQSNPTGVETAKP